MSASGSKALSFPLIELPHSWCTWPAALWKTHLPCGGPLRRRHFSRTANGRKGDGCTR